MTSRVVTSLFYFHVCRLSTIRQADSIAVLQEGVILEQGTHNDLVARGTAGAYYSLVHSQAGSH